MIVVDDKCFSSSSVVCWDFRISVEWFHWLSSLSLPSMRGLLLRLIRSLHRVTSECFRGCNDYVHVVNFDGTDGENWRAFESNLFQSFPRLRTGKQHLNDSDTRHLRTRPLSGAWLCWRGWQRRCSGSTHVYRSLQEFVRSIVRRYEDQSAKTQIQPQMSNDGHLIQLVLIFIYRPRRMKGSDGVVASPSTNQTPCVLTSQRLVWATPRLHSL